MVKTKAKVEETPMVSLTVFNALQARVEVLETEQKKLIQDVSILKKLPADLITQQSILNRHTERLDSMTASVGSLTQRVESLPSPKPKKRFGII